MSGSAAIGIICKTPLAGRSKTRLISALGPQGAAELAACFLRDVAAAIEAIPAAVGRRGYAVYAPEGSEAQLSALLPADFGLLCRSGATLATVLLGATERLLAEGHDSVLLVNADSPTMPPLLLASGLAALRAPGDRVVLGPATDGGYYLIGLKAPHAHLFADIPWSTADVTAATLERAAEIGLEALLLPRWYDVDEPESLALLLDEMAGKPLPFATSGLAGGRAAATRAFLARQRDSLPRPVRDGAEVPAP